MNMQIFQLIKRETSPQSYPTNISKLQVLWGKTKLNSPSGKSEGWCLGRFPFPCVNFSCHSVGTTAWNALRDIKMLFFPRVNWLRSGLTCTQLGEFCKMFIVMTTQLSPVQGVQALLIQPQFHVNVSCIWLLGCWVYVLTLKYISYENQKWFLVYKNAWTEWYLFSFGSYPFKKYHPISA